MRARFALILYFHMVAHKAACHTLSKDMVKVLWMLEVLSHKVQRLKICSMVLLPALILICSSAIISSALGLSLIKMISSMTLLERLMKLIGM